jgi:hypothetical protein
MTKGRLRPPAAAHKSRIAQVARLLFSPISDNEALAARSAIQRDLTSLGLDHHDLADAIEAGFERLGSPANDDDDLPDEADARALIDELLANRTRWLTAWELVNAARRAGSSRCRIIWW